MPSYEYQCDHCGERWTMLRHPDDADAPVVCPICDRMGRPVHESMGRTLDMVWDGRGNRRGDY